MWSVQKLELCDTMLTSVTVFMCCVQKSINQKLGLCDVMLSCVTVFMCFVQKSNNQKLGLCEALLEIGAWDCAKIILDGLPEGFAISHKPIVQALCRLIHAAIEPMYYK